MKKYYLFFAVLYMLFSASSFAGTDTLVNAGFKKSPVNTNTNAVKDTSSIKTNSNIISSFKGSINNNTSKLHWITENEQGMKSFTIERSENNRDFYPIAIMPAMNEKGQLFYEYPDKDISRLSSQTFSYRLKITDAGNKDNYSPVITLYPDNKNGAVAIR